MRASGSEHDPTILIVEDDTGNLLALETAVQPLGEKIVTCGSAEDALRLLLRHNFAVILMDIQLPGMDGFEAAEAIRGRGQSSLTPIVFITGMDPDDGNVARGYSLGAVDFIFKPVVPEILRAKVSVFVELHRKTLRITAHEREREREREQRQELELALRHYRALSSAGSSTSVTQAMSVGSSLRKLEPALSAEIDVQYQALLEVYLEGMVVKQPKPRAEMERLTAMLGDHGAGPRDLIDIHTRAIEDIGRSSRAARARACAVEGRLFVVEMMGYLVEYYRVGTRRAVQPRKPTPEGKQT